MTECHTTPFRVVKVKAKRAIYSPDGKRIFPEMLEKHYNNLGQPGSSGKPFLRKRE